MFFPAIVLTLYWRN